VDALKTRVAGARTGGIVKTLLAGLLLIALGLLVVACGNSPTPQPTVTVPVKAAASAGASVSPTPKPTKAAHVLLLSAGTYVVGTAIPAGNYTGTPGSPNSHYQIWTDPNGKNIVAKSPPLTGQFHLKLKKGQYLEVSGALQITKVK
jgi:hypothetical protein